MNKWAVFIAGVLAGMIMAVAADHFIDLAQLHMMVPKIYACAAMGALHRLMIRELKAVGIRSNLQTSA